MLAASGGAHPRFPLSVGWRGLPYGIYDLKMNAGTVVVGTSHDTAEFTVNAIETWLTFPMDDFIIRT